MEIKLTIDSNNIVYQNITDNFGNIYLVTNWNNKKGYYIVSKTPPFDQTYNLTLDKIITINKQTFKLKDTLTLEILDVGE